MNGFRVTLLVLLTLAVVALLCLVTFFQNSQKEAYDAYLAAVKANERQQMIADHKDKMERIGVQDESAEAKALEEARRKQEEEVMQQEERNVLASAKRKDGSQNQQQPTAGEQAQRPLGLVASYNEKWGFIMIRPVSEEPMPKGMVVALRRNGNIICEAELGEKDADGQISATIRQAQFTQGLEGISQDKFIPAVGDDVIISPYMSSRELRAAGAAGSLLPAPLPQVPEGAQPSEGLQEVDASLIPMP